MAAGKKEKILKEKEKKKLRDRKGENRRDKRWIIGEPEVEKIYLKK